MKKIGVPEKEPFVADTFQIEAIKAARMGDVIVSAPTGSGKTYIALESMAEVLEAGGRCWYASPLKALSNAKFLEFGGHFGESRVGLLTGDHKVRPEAPLIVGTTEILRNQLYDAMNRGQSVASDLVIMDEAHYLGDPDRGVVWEEVIIYLRPRVRLLLLSATVDNAREIADWISYVRGQACRAIVSHERPVPLYPLFLFPDGELDLLSGKRGLNPRIRHLLESGRVRGRGRPAHREPPPIGRTLTALAGENLLPAIFFLKSRADCDQALVRCSRRLVFADPMIKIRRNNRIDQILEDYPFLKTHPHLKYLRSPGVAAHHAGHMPHWKLLIERLMQEGLLAAIFATSTVAAGVNFPARTVVITQSDRFNGHEFVDLTATELLQMTGRAGRRGMDRIGFALIVPGPYQNPAYIHNLFDSPPEPVTSRLQVNFSMALNLLQSHRPEEIHQLLDLSLAAFQQGRSGSARKIEQIRAKVDRMLADGLCSEHEEALYLFRRYRELSREQRELAQALPRAERETALQTFLTPGRLFEVYGGLRFCAVRADYRRGQTGILAAKLRQTLGLKKGRLRLKWIPLGRISRLLDTVIECDPEDEPEAALKRIREEAGRDHSGLEWEDAVIEAPGDRIRALNIRSDVLNKELANLPCRPCAFFSSCHADEDPEHPGEVHGLLQRLDLLDSAGRGSGKLLWSSFLRHLNFLQAEGFVDPEGDLAEDGHWAARLRLDHPLLMAAGIRANAWPTENPALLAALVSPFVVDRERIAEPHLTLPKTFGNLAAAWLLLEDALRPLMRKLQAENFDVPKPNLRAALAVYAWATLLPWEDVIRLYGQDPGDMAMLVFRAADNLRQMAALTDSHPQLAANARNAFHLILRDPVTVPL